MTGEHDGDWLADDEANLRPHVARALLGSFGPGQAHDPRVAVPVPDHRPAPTVGASTWPIMQGVGALLGLAIVMIVLSVTLVRSCRENALITRTRQEGVVIRPNVDVRQTPGYGYPPVDYLRLHEKVLVVAVNDEGWFRIATENGHELGWIFGAYVKGVRCRGFMTCRVVKPVYSSGTRDPIFVPGQIVLTSGREDADSITVVYPLPSPTRIPADAVAPLE